MFLPLIAVAALLVACASGDKPLDAVDPNAVAQNPTFDQVNAIIHNKCVSCHAATSGEGGNDFRTGVVSEIFPLDTCFDIVGERFDILDRIQNNTMPPGVFPRCTSEEKLLIQRWVENGAPAPCNPQP
ncbi:MAG TPA: hypothetical protein VJS69_11585 [Candidatus Krumholzibacteria bacterium]|nr:hypothetical protein [Candidatus Krumholzibacteria bacterium]